MSGLKWTAVYREPRPAPCPSSLPEKTGTRRHADRAEALLAGRSLSDPIAILNDLRARGVKFHSLTEAINTATPTGRAMWQMIGVPAEPERSLISERTRAGVKAAQRRGVKFGRMRHVSGYGLR